MGLIQEIPNVHTIFTSIVYSLLKSILSAAAAMAGAATNPTEQPISVPVSATLLTLFFLLIIATAWAAHRTARFRAVQDVIRNRLTILVPTRGLGSDMLNEMPTAVYHAPRSNASADGQQTPRAVGETQLQRSSPTARSTSLRGRIQRIVAKMMGVKAEGSTPAGRSTCCSICTEDFCEGVEIRILPCKHIFHPACIDPWLRDRARTCPLW